MEDYFKGVILFTYEFNGIEIKNLTSCGGVYANKGKENCTDNQNLGKLQSNDKNLKNTR